MYYTDSGLISHLQLEEKAFQVQDTIPSIFDTSYPLSSFVTYLGADDISLLGGNIRYSNDLFAISSYGYNQLEGQVLLVRSLAVYSFTTTATISPPLPDSQFFGRSIAFDFPWLVVSAPAYDLHNGAAYVYAVNEAGEAKLNATLPSRGVRVWVWI
ncbi:hypothetical protein EON65_20675 [archaeon]|nr:MAG: hypothetical protein EON65_20675 [archaeon]